jgi:hypothetical protein
MASSGKSRKDEKTGQNGIGKKMTLKRQTK